MKPRTVTTSMLPPARREHSADTIETFFAAQRAATESCLGDFFA